jgi:hypothetical protein
VRHGRRLLAPTAIVQRTAFDSHRTPPRMSPAPSANSTDSRPGAILGLLRARCHRSSPLEWTGFHGPGHPLARIRGLAAFVAGLPIAHTSLQTVARRRTRRSRAAKEVTR